MKILQKALSSAQKRQRRLWAKLAAELAEMPTPELLPMASKAKEDIL